MHRTATRATGAQFAQNSVRGGGRWELENRPYEGDRGVQTEKGLGEGKMGVHETLFIGWTPTGGVQGSEPIMRVSNSVKLGFSSNENWTRQILFPKPNSEENLIRRNNFLRHPCFGMRPIFVKKFAHFVQLSQKLCK